MTVAKYHRFAVDATSAGGSLVAASAEGKPTLSVAVPPEFRGGVEGVWSPEELLVGSAATCYAVTLAALAARSDVALRDLRVEGVGHVMRRSDGRFGFATIELEAMFETDAALSTKARRLADKAKHICIVTTALDVPVHLTVVVREPVSQGVA